MKAVLYLALALFIFIFNDFVMPYVGILVGAIVCLYAVEEFAFYAFKRELSSDTYHLFDSIAQFLIGAILFIVSEDIIKVCLVWGVWSILRESKELSEGIKKFPTKKTEIITVTESVIVIVLSFLMILEPSESHAHLHLILLGVELVIVVIFYLIEIIVNKLTRQRINKTDSTGGEEISI